MPAFLKHFHTWEKLVRFDLQINKEEREITLYQALI